MNRVSCDNCMNEFKIDILTKEVKDGLFEEYFLCNNCGEKYHIIYMNHKTRKLRNETERLFKLAQSTTLRKDRRSYQRSKDRLTKNTRTLYRLIGKEDMFRGGSKDD